MFHANNGIPICLSLTEAAGDVVGGRNGVA